MPKRKKLLRIGIALLIAGVVFLLIPPYNEYCQHEYSNEEYCAAYKVVAFLGATFDKYNGTVTALATALLAYITYGLVTAGQEQTKTTRAQLRAYVGILGGSIVLKNNYAVSVEIYARNQGQTPAHDVEHFIDVGFNDLGDYSPGPIGTVFPQKWVMAPQALWTLLHPPAERHSWDPASERFNPDEDGAQAFEMDMKELIVWGRIAYRDVFSHTSNRETLFCYRAGAAASLRVGDTAAGIKRRWELEPCAEGNTST
jgi:hypothetical protein